MIWSETEEVIFVFMIWAMITPVGPFIKFKSYSNVKLFPNFSKFKKNTHIMLMKNNIYKS